MISPKECAESWKIVCECYKNTIEQNNPEITMKAIVDKLGLDITKEVFAVIAKMKQLDGRIYGKNRDYMEDVEFNPECVKWEPGNPVIYAGLDDIHTAHINNLISELYRMDKEAAKEQEEERV